MTTGDLVPIESRGVYQSYINIMYGLGSALGAATGGAIADSLGWRWEFGIQVPYIAICTLVAALTVPRSLGLETVGTEENFFDAMKAFDYTGSLLLATSITFLILGLVSSSIPYIETNAYICRMWVGTFFPGHTGLSYCHCAFLLSAFLYSYGMKPKPHGQSCHLICSDTALEPISSLLMLLAQSLSMVSKRRSIPNMTNI